MIQIFYCKNCKEDFSIEKDDKFWNYNCPNCGNISMQKGYTLPRFKGLPTIKS
jgi:predicted RNA-binding Zn-ribbon protein involved in translation (DUF1610 family)